MKVVTHVRENMDVKKALELFREFLIVSWPILLAFKEQHVGDDFDDFRINWLQGNWELTVEHSILIGPYFLQIYGEGADFGGKSSRVCFSDALPTHQIVCHPKKDGIILKGNLNTANLASKSTLMIFDSFVTSTDAGWFEEAPPFDCVIADYGDTQVLFKFEDSEFSLEKIEPT